MKQDDPKKCTSAKLNRFKMVKPIFRRAQIPRRAVVLNPYAEYVFSPGDRNAVERGGLVIVDCSWEKAEPVFSRRYKGIKLRLPTLLAANPVNYGRAHKLSSAEALAAALYIVNFKDEAKKIMSLFKWGPNFIQLNWGPLEDYSLAKNGDGIRKVEEEYFGMRKLDEDQPSG